MSKSAKSAFLKKRKRKDRIFRLCCLGSILVALSFLIILLYTICGNGLSAMNRAEAMLPINFDSKVIDPDGTRLAENIEKASYGKLINEALDIVFPEASGRRDKIGLYRIISKDAAIALREKTMHDPSIIGKMQRVWVPLSSDADLYFRHIRGKDSSRYQTRLDDKQIQYIEKLAERGLIRIDLSKSFFLNADSREPEQAGVLGAIIGSIFTIAVCLLISFPIGVLAAIYLEEFAPKNALTRLIEVNINNLAAIPSIIFGLLGLVLYLQFAGMPRSSALVGGLTLSFLILPTIIISTRAAISAVPPSIRDAALAVGASPLQAVMHHVLPLALPGVMTGTILGVARALGETAPLLMIGMVAFVADLPSAITDPATALPVQVFLWADSPEPAFAEKTSGAIIVLLFFMVCLNAIAIFIRSKFERRW